MTRFERVPHAHLADRRRAGPVTVASQHRTTGAYARFNTKVAVTTTRLVGSMTCAWVFAALALISLPAAISSGDVITIVGWVAQTFLQLVLLSVIMVGQNVQADAADARSNATYQDVEAMLHEFAEAHRHMDTQDQAIAEIRALLRTAADSTRGLAPTDPQPREAP